MRCATCPPSGCACTCAGATTRDPHHHDVPMERLLPIVLKAKPQGLLFEAANPRHAHEWAVFKNVKIPEDKVLIPGVLATTTNYIEHPRAGGRAHRALRRHRRPRPGHRRHRLRLRHLCRLRAGRARHRLPEAAGPWSRGRSIASAPPVALAAGGALIAGIGPARSPPCRGDRTGRRRRSASTTIARSTWPSSPPATRSRPSRAAPRTR